VITVSEVGAEPVVPLAYEPQQSGTPQPELVLGSLGRPLHRVAHRWSFTQISGAIRHSDSVDVAAGVDVTDPHGSDSGANDEGSAPLALTTEFETPIGAQWSGLPMLEGLGGGAPFGNLIHGMFEDLDFASPNLESQISDWLHATQKFGVTELQHERLPQELCEVIRTPFGPHFAELSLADLTAASRLNELNFYFPLSPNSPVNAGRIGALVADHLTTNDPLWPWATSLASGLRHVDLQGFLTGSIDLTLRFTKDGIERYSVVDYKSNRLTPAGSDPTLSDYHPDKLPHAMAHSNYVLQSLVYAVALHRYLRWRLADYNPAVHLGPVGYLFVRGMVGANAPRSESSATLNVPSGVFSWDLPTGLVEALSDLLAGPSDGGASK
jgi:exodeoxyribonuclease V beta subunit